MKVSSKGRYGIRALIDLTVNSKEGHVSLVSIAGRNQISTHYLEHVFASLKRGGIVKSVKGAQGGYVLAREPGEINVADIMDALEGGYRIEPEPQNENVLCNTVTDVMNKKLWEPYNEHTREFLEKITLADLADAFTDKFEEDGMMYYI